MLNSKSFSYSCMSRKTSLCHLMPSLGNPKGVLLTHGAIVSMVYGLTSTMYANSFEGSKVSYSLCSVSLPTVLFVNILLECCRVDVSAWLTAWFGIGTESRRFSWNLLQRLTWRRCFFSVNYTLTARHPFHFHCLLRAIENHVTSDFSIDHSMGFKPVVLHFKIATLALCKSFDMWKTLRETLYQNNGNWWRKLSKRFAFF